MGIHPRKVGLLGGFLPFRHNVWPFFWGHVIAGGLSFHDATVCSKVA